MPDENSPAADDIPVKKAVRDLLADIRKREPLRGSSGFTEAIPGLTEHGVRVITYTFDANKPNHDSKGRVADVATMNKEQREAVAHVLGEIEKVANVKFRRVAHVDLIGKADVRFFQGRILSPDSGGYTANWDHIRDVIIDNRSPSESFAFGKNGYAVVAHEILHALGLSHPGGGGSLGGPANGSNPLYTKDSTVMSYNSGKVLVMGLGPFDVAALQYLYGKPVGQPSQRTVNAGELLKSSVLYSGAPITLEFNRDAHEREVWGDVSMDLASPKFDRQITGVAGPAAIGAGQYLGVRLAPGTQVKDVLSGPESRVELHVKGNRLPNVLQGGARDDILTPTGGNDVLTGGRGKDTFVLTPHSGADNRVTDFNPSEDTLKIIGFTRLVLHSGPEGKNTEVLIKDKEGAVIASMILANDRREVKPADVKVMIDSLKESESMPTAPEAHPSKPQTIPALPGTPMGQRTLK